MPRLTSKDYANDIGEYDVFPHARVAGTSKAATDPIRNAAASAGLRAWLQAPLNVKSRTFGATGDGTTDDTTALQAALTATVAGDSITLPAGTYITTGIVIPRRVRFIISPGATLKLKASAANNSKLIDVQAADVVIELYGTLDGNYANQGSATGHSAIYTTSDRVKVLGFGRTGYITGFRGNAVYFVDCDDGVVDGLRIDNCLTRCVYGQLLTTGQTLARFKVRDILADRTAQGSGATEGCVEIENQAGGSDVITDPVVDNIDAYLHASADAFGVEVYGGVVGGLVRPTVRNVYGSGGGAVLSVDHATGGTLENIRGYNFNATGIELAHCTGGLALVGFYLDCNSVATCTGLIVDNQNHDGVDLVISTGTVLNPSSYGVHLKGASGGTMPKQVTVVAVTVRSSVASAVGFLAEYAPGAKFASCRFFGSAASQEGFVAYQSAGASLDQPYVEFSAGASNAIRVELVTDFTVASPNLIGGGTANNALTLIDVQRGNVTGAMTKGFDTRMLELVVNSGQTIANLEIEVSGDGNGDVVLTNNSGTVSGDTIRLSVPRGWAPYGILTGMQFSRFHGTTSSSNVLEGGIFSGNPQTDPVPYGGYAFYNGNLYTNKAGTWTAAN